MNRRINKLAYKLDKDKRINNLSLYGGEKKDPNWVFYYNISGFIGEFYFQIYISEHRETQKTIFKVDLTTDNEVKEEIAGIIYQYAKITVKTR